MNYIWNGFWIVNGQTLKLRECELNFNLATQKSSTTFVWAHFPGLWIYYWKENIIMALEETVGRPIKDDEITLKREVGYYASVLVEVDLAKNIPNHVSVKTK